MGRACPPSRQGGEQKARRSRRQPANAGRLDRTAAAALELDRAPPSARRAPAPASPPHRASLARRSRVDRASIAGRAAPDSPVPGPEHSLSPWASRVDPHGSRKKKQGKRLLLLGQFISTGASGPALGQHQQQRGDASGLRQGSDEETGCRRPRAESLLPKLKKAYARWIPRPIRVPETPRREGPARDRDRAQPFAQAKRSRVEPHLGKLLVTAHQS